MVSPTKATNDKLERSGTSRPNLCVGDGWHLHPEIQGVPKLFLEGVDRSDQEKSKSLLMHSSIGAKSRRWRQHTGSNRSTRAFGVRLVPDDDEDLWLRGRVLFRDAPAILLPQPTIGLHKDCRTRYVGFAQLLTLVACSRYSAPGTNLLCKARGRGGPARSQ